MAMMAMLPAMMVVALLVPAVMMAATAVMLPVSVSMLAALDLDDICSRGAENARCCGGHSRRRQGWGQRKSAGRKSDQQKPLHVGDSPLLNSHHRDEKGKF